MADQKANVYSQIALMGSLASPTEDVVTAEAVDVTTKSVTFSFKDGALKETFTAETKLKDTALAGIQNLAVVKFNSKTGEMLGFENPKHEEVKQTGKRSGCVTNFKPPML